jgi:formate-dependent nitrite reductase membrane component NrfD
MTKYTPQTDWIEGHGILIAFALFFGGISGGLYLASLFFDNLLGMFIAWILAMATGMSDMAHLSKPLRFWRMLLKPGSSWISRGFILIWLFLGCAAVQLALSYWLPGTAAETVFQVLAGITAFGVAVYSGFVLGYVGAIKLWNSAILPILFVVAGLTGGMAILMLASQGESNAYITDVANGMLVALVIYAISVASYLWISTYESNVARDSVKLMLKGSVAAVFWIGVVLVGIIIPIVVVAPFALAGNVQPVSFIIASVCVIVGGITLRYSILKAGMYSPLLPVD